MYLLRRVNKGNASLSPSPLFAAVQATTRKHCNKARNNPTLFKAWEKVRDVLSFPESWIAEQIKLSTTLQSKFTDYRLIEPGCYLVHNRPNI